MIAYCCEPKMYAFPSGRKAAHDRKCERFPGTKLTDRPLGLPLSRIETWYRHPDECNCPDTCAYVNAHLDDEIGRVV